MVSLARVVVAAATSSAGKTTTTIGVMAALRERGRVVSPHKVGPDYIDPGFHALATGRPGRNLDPWLCGEDRIVPLLLHGAAGADVAVIEGVMGLFDGRLGTRGFGSTAHVARLVSAPVVLVLDAAHTSRTAAAVVAGLAGYDPSLTLAGVILNRVGSPRHTTEITDALSEVGIATLGAIPRRAGLATPSRHLGLVPAAERDAAAAVVAEAGRLVADHVDLDAVLALADAAPALTGRPWSPTDEVFPVAGRPVIAVAGGRAFTFRYAETAELLRAAGCEVVVFDPLTDADLPPGTAGLYLGGGFPEVFADELAGNTALRTSIAAAVAGGLPTVAECAGLLYLADSLDGRPMAGAVPVTAQMTERLTLGYHTAVAASDTLLATSGEEVTAHEFHRTAVSARPGAPVHAAWLVGDERRPDGVSADPAGLGRPSVHASYQHVHWAGYPRLAQRFADAAAAFAGRGRIDLDHHGDADAAPGLTDLAVNVRTPAPAWLVEAITAPTTWLSYPDPDAARAALAARHGVEEACVLPTAGATEAFTLIARALGRTDRTPRAVVVHPQFTEGEAALRRAGWAVRRLVLSATDGFALPDDDPIGLDADLVAVGNPTNPTGTLHAAASLRRWVRPGRVLVVDEAFMDFVPGEAESLAAPGGDLADLVVLRSATKMWGIPGVRAGHVVGDPALVERLAAQQPPWSVSGAALAALVACSSPAARAEAEAVARAFAADCAAVTGRLAELGLPVAGRPATPFVLLDAGALAGAHPGGVRERLAEAGFAVRRGETFPGLGPHWIRVALRDPATHDRFLEALAGLRRASGAAPR